MGKKLYVGGVSYGTSEETLHDLFETVGSVTSVRVITDRETGRSKGFAFVEMATAEDAQEAITKFNGSELEGRRLMVNEARPLPPRDNSSNNRSSYGGNSYRR